MRILLVLLKNFDFVMQSVASFLKNLKFFNQLCSSFLVPIHPIPLSVLKYVRIIVLENKFSQAKLQPKQIVQKLKSHGMHFNGEGKAESYLMYIDYHRQSAYIFHSTKSIKTTWFYKTVHAFEQVMALYRFDKKLRIMLFNEIEKIEVAIRRV